MRSCDVPTLPNLDFALLDLHTSLAPDPAGSPRRGSESPRLVHTEYQPRRGRGVAATRLRGISAPRNYSCRDAKVLGYSC